MIHCSAGGGRGSQVAGRVPCTAGTPILSAKRSIVNSRPSWVSCGLFGIRKIRLRRPRNSADLGDGWTLVVWKGADGLVI